MNVFDLLTLLGGLAMFLYGMRLMGDGLREGSSGTLKVAMEHVTNNTVKAFLLGLIITALIQSSTATIVITAGLVGAGIITLRQSLGIIIGANVGTTVTGQIIRLLDIDAGSAAWLQIFKPSTLAPVALVIGITCIMFLKFHNHNTVGSIAVGFGILFSGLMTMTGAVDSLNETGLFDRLFASLGDNPFLGYLTGAGVAFILQSSSATIGILQAFASSGQLYFRSIYAVIVGIYLGDCVTTAIVCSIGAKAEARRVGIVNILFNLSETVLVLLSVFVIHKLGFINTLWDSRVTSGIIANTNTIFNLGCAILLFPMLSVYEKISKRIIHDEPAPVNPYSDQLDALSPAFFSTPALALKSCYDLLLSMLRAARSNVARAMWLLYDYDDSTNDLLRAEEKNIDLITDKVSNYLVALSPHISTPLHVSILNHYYKVITEFERLGDHAVNIADTAKTMHDQNVSFSPNALAELRVMAQLLDRIMEHTENAFWKRDADAASHIEPLEEVVDDLVSLLKDNHLQRMCSGKCSPVTDVGFTNLLADIERISDICSEIGVATVARVHPELANQAHRYVSSLHAGTNETYNQEYAEAHAEFTTLLHEAQMQVHAN